ncbi:hypothetical protein [Chroococcidiopsis sp. TS-821]|uniref:hypothetical protein n=1 Tax=Chroococcidiopsis sp. TS-821 TaxID=1378066 RepID=UPI000CEF5543|nr:hypothetical protein [Chroococcidiopsis sp. TS-821]PPS43992.1 hypothetical protein B1A85_08385 [Chroococcidiopsis sp. TS-821]
MPNHYSILDDENRVYGEWHGHLHYTLMYQSREKAETVAREHHILGYKIVPSEAAVRYSESRYSEHK